jgi:Response regulator receiver domain
MLSAMHRPACARTRAVERGAPLRAPVLPPEVLAILGLQGYAVACASNGRQALSFLDAHTAGEICVILLDLMMPVMSGYEFVDHRRQASTDIPFVRKPIGLEELLSTVRR